MNDQNEVTLNSWEEFEGKLRELDEFRNNKKKETGRYFSRFKYRGQADSRWKLETTLDRIVSKEIKLLTYYVLATHAQPRIEVLTGTAWNIPTYEEYKEWLVSQGAIFFTNFVAYDFFAYLRHHGFPSPLLDWTTSPYVAAFFAMNKVSKGVDYVSVYVFADYTSGGKSSSSNDPAIYGLGSEVAVHRRHFMQQSQYTICTVTRDSERHYTRHEDVVSKNNPDQDLLWKFNIPTTERIRILEKLQTMNINSFSLFGTEDSLIDSIATSVFWLEPHGL